MTIRIPGTGETFNAQLVADERGVLRLIEGHPWKADYVFSAVLALGWQIVESTADERAAGRARVRELEVVVMSDESAAGGRGAFGVVLPFRQKGPIRRPADENTCCGLSIALVESLLNNLAFLASVVEAYSETLRVFQDQEMSGGVTTVNGRPFQDFDRRLRDCDLPMIVATIELARATVAIRRSPDSPESQDAQLASCLSRYEQTLAALTKSDRDDDER